MDVFHFSESERVLLEGLQHPLAVYQFVNMQVVPLILSDGFCELFGYESREQAYRDMRQDLYRDVHPDDTVRVADAAYRFATEGGRYEIIYRARCLGSEAYHIIHSAGRHVFTSEGVRLAHVWYTDEGLYTDGACTESSEFNRKLSNALHEESILQGTHYDYLTGLPSMAYFFELAEAGKETILHAGENAVLLYLDLNGMKFYNHHHSYAEGDKRLKDFAGLLVRFFGKNFCCHAGADHFIAYTEENGIEERLRSFFAAWKERCAGAALSVRVGVYSTALGDCPVSTATDRAKLACDALKGSFDSVFRFYSPDLKDEAIRKRYIQESIDEAVASGWIQVYYQPIVRAVNGRVCDEEALARWFDPVKGPLSPAEFIPPLEEAGLAYKLDLCVLEQVIEKLLMQQKAGLHLVSQSLNLSRSDFDACDIVEEIRQRVDAAGLSRSLINIEITESVIGKDFSFMKEQITRFQSLGFPVWMDDFGSGYSSLDVLQSVKFNLLKFDMSFMQKLDEGDWGKIILTELMKMATSLGLDTICEGVETEEQVRFLREIGCSKLQGYYFCKPIPFEEILRRYEAGRQIGFEEPRESAYYEAIGRVNLYDMAVLANEDENAFQNFFNTLPIAIMEIQDGEVRFVRTNQSYRAFMQRFFNMDLSDRRDGYTASPFGQGSNFMSLVNNCCESGVRAFFDEEMPDGSVVHSFARRIAVNPVTGTMAAAIAVLSIASPGEGATYAGIARALAADYYNIYYFDMETESFLEYSSPVGKDELAMERHGESFFEEARASAQRIYEEDRKSFFASFTKENILRELDRQGLFTMTYRLMENGVPVYVNMKITRMDPQGKRIIMGVSKVDEQMKQKADDERVQHERDTLARIMALSEDYLTLYSVNPETGAYIEYSATNEYRSLGFDAAGEDFFERGRLDAERAVCPEDLPRYLASFTRENILREVEENGIFKLQYRLMLTGQPRWVSLKIAPFRVGEERRLVVGLRAWRERR